MSSSSVPYVNLAAQWQDEKQDLLPIIESVMSSGQFVGGDVVEDFEQKAAELCGTRYCVALNSGTDALVCGLLALGVQAGDEVISPPNSFIASTAAIVHIKAKPVFVDVLPDQNIDPSRIEEEITTKNDKGETVTTEREVVTRKAFQFAIRMPNRKGYDDADLFYSVKLSEGIKAGLLTRPLLEKRYENDVKKGVRTEIVHKYTPQGRESLLFFF